MHGADRRSSALSAPDLDVAGKEQVVADLSIAAARIQAKTMPIPFSGCMVFMGAVNNLGYGTIKIDGKKKMVHRVMYEELVGKIPNGMVIDHKCRIPGCWNPSHLDVVTQAENVFRGFSPHANNARKSACDRGHPFDGKGFRLEPQPGGKVMRRCLICRRDRDRLRKRLARQKQMT